MFEKPFPGTREVRPVFANPVTTWIGCFGYDFVKSMDVTLALAERWRAVS